MPIDWNRLSAPFDPDDIEWKPGAVTRDKSKGLAMAYITARAVQERLDEVFGPGGWKNEFRAGPEGGVICRIYFKNDDGDWVWREDGADNTDVEAVKGGLSNAMKRAGAALGIGRYLYKLPQQWVPLDERGRFAQTPRVPAEFIPDSIRDAPTSPSRPVPDRTRLAGSQRSNSQRSIRQDATGPGAPIPSDALNDLYAREAKPRGWTADSFRARYNRLVEDGLSEAEAVVEMRSIVQTEG